MITEGGGEGGGEKRHISAESLKINISGGGGVGRLIKF